MREFRFNLEKLLELRRYEEREWELRLARITGECLLLENKIEANRQKIGLGARQAVTPGYAMDIQRLIDGDIYIYRLYSEISRFRKELDKKNKKRAEISREYLAHSRKRKVLDKLKEKKAAAYYKEQRREEFKVLDDVNNGARIRRKQAEL